MRDIKSSPKFENRSSYHRAPEDLPPDAKKLYEKHRSKKLTPRFAGSKVPVTNVHLPRQMTASRPAAANMVASLPDTRPRFVTKSTPQAAGAHSPKRSRVRMQLGQRERMVVVALSVLVVVALLSAGILFLPKATIELVLETAPLLVDQQVTVKNNAAAGSPEVPGNSYVREVQVNGISPVLSRKIVGEKARGVVTIVNKTIDEQKIKEQSRLVTADGILFYMQRHAIVPGSGAVSVEVEAAEAGPPGNISSGRLNFAALDSASQSLVFAEVNQSLTGGSGEEVAVVQEQDVEQAKQAAATAARQKVEQEIRAELKPGWTVLEESWNSELKDFSTEATVDENRDSIGYGGRVLVRVIAFEEQVLEGQLKAALEAKLDEQYMLFPGPISFTKAVESIDWDNNEALITARVTHTTIPTFSLETLKDKLAGRQREEAVEYVNGLPGVESVSVKLSPFWVRSVPRIDRRISIDLISNREP